MNSQLVSAASDWDEGNSDPAFLCTDLFPVGDADFPMNLIIDLYRAVIDIEPEG
ncbi:MAG: hypothetical protein ACSHX7_14325 [Luteolibacter sp.]